MFTKLSIVAPAAFSIIALISSVSAQCNSGGLMCCDSTQDSKTPTAFNLLAPLGVVLQGLSGQIGVGCTPVTVEGGQVGSVCDSHALCCAGRVPNQSGNLFGLSCTPFSIG
ncbi:hypothetical protein JAAARDRAFT_203828 [Jaapia argillacea MUCL 33604]|uniref:Hydrophobin n=1 Tax=Jaapia argillacea MUCL 33604 TaxID=933084 RepID=A0A067QJI6_9AGAM|nr:hypothetical protein JAAARDRAFT_203828 [Jaapia argillacea MUCL 33604]